MKLEALKPGMTVYSVGRQKMGNTTVSTTVILRFTIVAIDAENRRVMAKNYGDSRWYSERRWSKWRLKEPILVRCGWGHRLATREEIAEMKAEKA